MVIGRGEQTCVTRLKSFLDNDSKNNIHDNRCKNTDNNEEDDDDDEDDDDGEIIFYISQIKAG